jgi:catechol 2,3-dioxygenase-like lactoylglutathione lyase family enzyme
MQYNLTNNPSRRQMLTLLGAGAASLLAIDITRAADLALTTAGLDHVGMTVPDQDATAKFYGRIFDPQLFQERDPPLRFYVKVGISYIGFGGGANTPAKIDHFCALVQDYKAQEVRKSLEEVGITMGAGPGGMPTDSDGLRLQLLGVPGGLAKTIIPATRISLDEPAVEAIGFDHIVLAVTDPEKSAVFYRRFFGMELSRTKKPERIWFASAKTRLGLEMVAPGKMPAVDHVCIKVAGFDRKAVTEKLKKLGAEIAPSNDEGLLRFQDLNGLTMELKAGS